jgi:undecaprenyl-diphosphatase
LPLIQILVLSVVQGITEFLPISSSGHLILVPLLTGWPDQGLAMDVAVHVGTLAAVLIYFWRDVWRMIVGLARLATGKRDRGALLVWYLIIGTIPALIVGWLVQEYAGDALRRMEVVAWTMVVFAVVLWLADRYGLTILRMEHLRASHAVIIGLFQCLAFMPGTSRSGITMVAGRLLGFERPEAARFSFLLSIPAIAAAGLWEGKKLYEAGTPQVWHDAVLAAGLSAITGILVIAALMAWLKRSTFAPFVIYRLVLGAGLLAVVYLHVPLR